MYSFTRGDEQIGASAGAAGNKAGDYPFASEGVNVKFLTIPNWYGTCIQWLMLFTTIEPSQASSMQRKFTAPQSDV
jgi:hypothetical protein